MVARELRFRYADEEIIVRAAERAGVSPEAVAQAERAPGLVMRILEAMGRSPVELEGLSSYAFLQSHDSASYEQLIEEVIRETAKAGQVVIVAHGASVPLAGSSGLLRVLVTASPAVRAERLAREAELDERKARKAVEESDRQRRQYLRRFYGVARELPTHYDLVVNTDVLTVQLAARLIVDTARAPG